MKSIWYPRLSHALVWHFPRAKSLSSFGTLTEHCHHTPKFEDQIHNLIKFFKFSIKSSLMTFHFTISF